MGMLARKRRDEGMRIYGGAPCEVGEAGEAWGTRRRAGGKRRRAGVGFCWAGVVLGIKVEGG